MIKYYFQKNLVCSLLMTTVLFYSGSGLSALSGDSHWVVEKGDSVYSIARKVFPDDVAKQRQFRKELVTSNPAIFNGNANQMSVGASLLLPAFAVSKPVVVKPVVESKPPAPVAEVLPPVEEKPVEEKTVTPDPEDVIGHVVISVGKMQANNRGVFRKLLRHSEILQGDTLTTSRSAYTQIRMKDGALISLRPNTKLQIIDYRFNGEEDGSERSVMELISGGFRTITGYIGHRNKQNYRVKTSVATIGIRGTHYGLMVCADGSCNEESASLEDGVYGGVVDGSIVVQNQSGASTFNNDQYFYVASLFQEPVEQLVPPPVFHGKAEKQAARQSDEKGNGNGNGNGDNGKDKSQTMKRKLAAAGRVSQKTIKGNRLGSLVQSYVDDRRTPVILRDQATDAIKDVPAINTAPNGSGALIAFTGLDSVDGTADSIAASVIVAAGNNNSIALGSIDLAGGEVINNLPIGMVEMSNGDIHKLILPSGVSGITGIGGASAAGVGVNWGRWSGADKFVLTENGVPQPTFGDLHYIYSDRLTTPAELSQLAALGGLTTSESYTFAGGTIPTNAAGQNVQLNNLSVVSDFVNLKIVDYQISAQDQGATFNMQASNIPFQNMSDFNLNEVSCNAGCTGRASAAFVGSQAGGLMTTYSIHETAGSVKGANGAAVLTRDSAAAAPPF